MSAIGVIATLRVQSGKEAEFEGIFAELATAVNANKAGNSYYRLFCDHYQAVNYQTENSLNGLGIVGS